MDAIRHETVQVNGVDLHVASAGDPSSPMILFLHGFPEFWYAWRFQLRDLSDRFFCVAPDCRGINLSGKPAALDAYEYAVLAADVVGLIRHFGRERAVVVGHDWGGFMAWEAAIRHPEAVERLVVLNCAHPGIMSELIHDPASSQSERSRYMLAFRSDRGEELVSRDNFGGFRANILEPGLAAGHLTESDAAAYFAAWNTPGSITGGLNYYRANRTGPVSGDDAPPRRVADTRVSMPTMVLWGEGDPYFSLENLDRMAEAVPDLRLHRFPACDHWIVHQIPDTVTALVREFAAG
ncbi:MAG: alpha/beta hydrolase [Pseudomonadota bacterium]|nr:alpha/beta hydrolase [Pseudomonadota bacterium]